MGNPYRCCETLDSGFEVVVAAMVVVLHELSYLLIDDNRGKMITKKADCQKSSEKKKTEHHRYDFICNVIVLQRSTDSYH